MISISKSYQYSFKETDDYEGVVYILKFTDKIKIGRTLNFDVRKKQLIKDFGNFEIIKLIQTDEIKKLEKEIHLDMKKYRIVLDEGSGRTEFFKHEILEEKEFKKWLN